MSAAAAQRAIAAGVAICAVTHSINTRAMIRAVVQTVPGFTRKAGPPGPASALALDAVTAAATVTFARTLDLTFVARSALPPGITPARAKDALSMLGAVLVTLSD